MGEVVPGKTSQREGQGRAGPSVCVSLIICCPPQGLQYIHCLFFSDSYYILWLKLLFKDFSSVKPCRVSSPVPLDLCVLLTTLHKCLDLFCRLDFQYGDYINLQNNAVRIFLLHSQNVTYETVMALLLSFQSIFTSVCQTLEWNPVWSCGTDILIVSMYIYCKKKRKEKKKDIHRLEYKLLSLFRDTVF